MEKNRNKKNQASSDSTCVALNQCAWKKNLFVILVLVLPIANFFVFWLYPNIDGILLSFKNMDSGKEYWTLENFAKCFDQIIHLSGGVGLALVNTLKFFAVSVITFPLGLFWGYVFYKKIRGYNFFRLMFFIPSIISSVILAGMFKYLINVDGPIGVLWANFFGSAPNFIRQEEYAFNVVLIYHYWAGMAGSLLLLGGAFAKIPNEIIDSANIDGVNWWIEMWSICIPLIWPTLSTLIIVLLTSLFFDGAPILLITGGAGNTTTVNYWMYDQIKVKGATYEPSTFGLILTIMTMIIVLPARKIINGMYADVEV